MHHSTTLVATSILLGSTGVAFAGEGVWLPVELIGTAEADAYASYMDWNDPNQDQSMDERLETAADSFEQLPAELDAWAWTDLSSASGTCRIDGGLREDGFWLSTETLTHALGNFSFDHEAIGSAGAQARASMVIKLYGQTRMSVSGWVSAQGMGALGIADVTIRDQTSGEFIAGWTPEFDFIEFDEELLLGPGLYTIEVASFGGCDRGYDQGSPDASTSEATLIDVTLSAHRPGDINGDGVVDGFDLGKLFAAWGTADPHADLDGDGIVDGRDMGILFADWG